jgi:uncharacterized iron-regulated membrane protein
LIVKVRDARGAMPSTITFRNEDSAPVLFGVGRDAVYADPYTGRILGEGCKTARSFFHIVTDWHRWLAADGEGRAVGKAVTGASNLAFLFLVCSGLYLWFPRAWNRVAVRSVTWFRGGLSGKARDFNWHNVIGFWCLVPLFFIILGATVISYPWASNLAYRLGGINTPMPSASPQAPGRPVIVERLDGLDSLWLRAQRQVPDWKTITLRLPSSDSTPVVFVIDRGFAGQPQYRGTLTLARATGDVEKWETFDNLDAGRRFRSWLRFVHTGEYYGLAGQTIAGIASAGAVVLVWTGVSLALRRLWAWRERRKRNGSAEISDKTPQQEVAV